MRAPGNNRLVASLSIVALSVPALVACGGGDESSSSITPLTSAPQAVKFNGEIVGNADDVHFSDVQDNTLKQALNLAGWNYCKFGAFFPLSGLQFADSCGTNANLLDVFGPAPAGFATASPAPRCLQLPLGSSTVSLTPVAGPGSADRRAHKLSCFQFLVTASAPVPLNVNLPAGVVGVAEVAYIASGGTFSKTAGVEGAGTLSMSPALTPARYVLIVRTENTAGGQPMGIGIGAPARAANQGSQAQTAVSSRLGEFVNGVTATPGVSAAYSFFPQRDGLTKQNLTATFTANQSVTYQVMQQTGPNTFVPYGNVATLTPAQSGQKVLVSPSNLANATSTTTPYGLMVKVTSTNAAAPANEAFKIRAATADNSLTGIGISNTETTSGYYPLQVGAGTQVVNYVDLSTFVRDVVGFGVPNEKVLVTVTQNVNVPTQTLTYTYETDMTGSLSKRFSFTPCSGSVTSYANYGPIGSPVDHWSGSHQIGEINISLPDAIADVSRLTQKKFQFTRICKETYLGRY